MNQISRLLIATSVMTVASPVFAAGGPSDTKPIMHTLRALNTRPPAPAVVSGRTLQGKPVEWNRPAPKSFLPPAGPPDPHRGQKPIIHTLLRL